MTRTLAIATFAAVYCFLAAIAFGGGSLGDCYTDCNLDTVCEHTCVSRYIDGKHPHCPSWCHDSKPPAVRAAEREHELQHKSCEDRCKDCTTTTGQEIACVQHCLLHNKPKCTR